jgi:hypothetical protein
MKPLYVLYQLILLFFLPLGYGQTVKFRNSSMLEGYQNFTIYFVISENERDKDSLSIKNEQIVRELVSEYWNTGNKIQFTDQDDLKEINRSDERNALIIEIKHIHESYDRYKQHARRQKQGLQITYYRFRIYSPGEKNVLAEIPSIGNTLDTLDVISNLNLLQYFIKQGAAGLTCRNWMTEINSHSAVLSKKELLTSDNYGHFSRLEAFCCSPDTIRRTSKSEILEQVEEHSGTSIYAITKYEPGSYGIRYRTIIMDCASGDPVCIYKWTAGK